MSKLPRKVRPGVWYLGKSYRSHVYFYTKSAMGTYGEPKGSPNYLGEIREGRTSNPHGIMSVKYSLSKKSHYNNQIKSNIRKVIKILRNK